MDENRDQANRLNEMDYMDSRGLQCESPYGKHPEVRSIPQQRVIQKMDEYMSRRDYQGAERHLKYWLEEAKAGHDRRGELMVRNELVGHYRKTGEKEEALKNAEEALLLLEELGFESTVSGGTTYVNTATACNAFGENERAMKLFQKARQVYEADKNTGPELLGGLYNNMALCAAAQDQFELAEELFGKALSVMEKVPGGELEQAITYLNMADMAVARYGMTESEEQTGIYLDKAYDLLTESSAPRDGYYAFVCEKCAPVFSYYGYFMAAKEIKDAAEKIYEGGKR